MVSSWSSPNAPEPFAPMIPTTLNDWLRMRMVSPTASTPSPNRLSRTTDPSTATLAAAATSVGVKKSPTATSQKRMRGSSTSTPSMRVNQFRPAAIT